MAKAFNKITETFKDKAGKRRVMVDIGEGEIIMLKFQNDATLTEIKNEVQLYIEREPIIKARKALLIQEGIEELQKEKTIIQNDLIK